MIFTTDIKEEEFEQFVSKQKNAHFMQSYYWAEVMKNKNFTPYFVGVKKDGKLVATALLLQKRLIKSISYFYSPRGFMVDFNDAEVLEYFTTEIKKFCESKGGIFIKIDPAIKRHSLDSDGNVVEGEDNNNLFSILKKQGFKHKGFNTEFVNEQPRFTFKLDINRDFEEVRKGMHPTTRKIFNKGNQYNLNCYVGNVNDIDAFYETMKDTYKRNDLAKTSYDYYKKFYSLLNKEGMSDLYVAKVNIKDLKAFYVSKIEAKEKEIEVLNSKENTNAKKLKNKINEINISIAKLNKEYDLVREMEDEEIVLSSIITVKYAGKVWTVHGGNTTELLHLNANYLVYFSIIEDANKNGYKSVDFFGTSGNPNPTKDNPIYGIHNFKKRLGGEYTEYIGEFDVILNKFLYFAFKILIPIRRTIVKSKLRRTD